LFADRAPVYCGDQNWCLQSRKDFEKPKFMTLVEFQEPN